ncbi:hypothetical protein BDN72DRAFT_579625 [Pluteus cervinus]|uniref:Uncharacterized protein n=1 Tax=Pluteus cervinus TaxID=181527 RepID=A0ACD3AW12_9AGAR|nr:hypothetical protein BDN72DRAFT_579625 [Pluteus cervinus]
MLDPRPPTSSIAIPRFEASCVRQFSGNNVASVSDSNFESHSLQEGLAKPKSSSSTRVDSITYVPSSKYHISILNRSPLSTANSRSAQSAVPSQPLMDNSSRHSLAHSGKKRVGGGYTVIHEVSLVTRVLYNNDLLVNQVTFGGVLVAQQDAKGLCADMAAE